MTTIINSLRYDLSLWRICSWCGKVLNFGNPDHKTHTMCAKCKEKWGA